MKEEIEAAALFITRLVNKNLAGCSDAGSSASSTHSSASSSSSSSASSSSSSSESPPGFDEHTPIGAVNGNDQDKVEQFRQCLTKALYERFRNHWFPDQPSKGQAYRCIRLNEWDRHDITLQKACLQCGIDYKDLQLPVELTLWVDPEEVTCRFGENKGSHCLVAKFKDGELKDNNFNIDINNIDIEIFRQTANSTATTTTTDRMWPANFHGPPEYNKQHNHQQSLNGHNMNNNHNSSYQFINHNQQHHQQAQLQHQIPPHQQHNQRSNTGKPAIIPPYHHNYLNGFDNNGNPISYYYF